MNTVLAGARAGHGGAVVVHGEPGIGKSTLLRAVMSRAEKDMTVLAADGVAAESALIFGGLQRLLGPVAATEGLSTPHRAAIDVALGQSTTSCTDLVLYTAVSRLAELAARHRPLLLAVDDAQWWDAASRAALLFVARRVSASPVAVLLAVRDVSTMDTTGLVELPLSGLSSVAAAGLLTELGVPSEGPRRAAMLAATGGNPLALGELARASADDLTLTGTAPLGQRLQAAFTERLRALPTATQHVLVLLAAEGSGRLDTVADAATEFGLDLTALDDAVRAGIVDEHGTFRHPLLRSAAYHGAGAAQRRAAHHALANQLDHEPDRALWHRALAADRPDESLAAQLEARATTVGRRGGLAGTASLLRRAALLSTTHDGRASRFAAAAYVAWKSGQPSLARSLTRQTTPEYLDKLHGLVALGDGDQRAAHDQLVRAANAVAHKEPASAVGLLFMAVITGHHAGMSEAVSAAARHIAGLDAGFGEYGRCLDLSFEGIAHPDQADPWQLRAAAPPALHASDVHKWLWPLMISRLGPDPLKAHAFGLRAAEAFTDNGMHAVQVLPELWLAELEFELGDWERGRARAEEGLRGAHDTSQRVRAADFHALLALFAAVRGDGAVCHDHAKRGLDLALPLGNRLAAAYASWALGLLALAEGDYHEAIARLTAITEPASPVAHEHIGRRAAVDTIEALLHNGENQRAQRTLEMFAAWAHTATTPLARARLAHAQALLTDDADTLFDQATALTEHPFDQARAALSYGRRLRRTRRTGRAGHVLRAAHDTFERLGARPWTQAAFTQLRPTGTARTPVLDAGTLTSQELAVARLAACGLSNREIGAKLFLSPRTVAYHLYKIFPKLGISARSQLRGLTDMLT